MTEQTRLESTTTDHLSWVRTRLTLERDFRDTTTQGFALIAAGFGSFAIFDGLAIADRRDALPSAFALAATAIGAASLSIRMGDGRRTD